MSIRVEYGRAEVTVYPAVFSVMDGNTVENYNPRDLAQAVAAVLRSWEYPVEKFIEDMKP